jgi:hypothetical protein
LEGYNLLVGTVSHPLFLVVNPNSRFQAPRLREIGVENGRQDDMMFAMKYFNLVMQGTIVRQ